MRGGERGSVNGRDPAQENMGALMPVAMSRFKRRRTRKGSSKEHTPPKTKSNGAAPAHLRSEVMRKRSRDKVVSEVEVLRTQVATRPRVAMRQLELELKRTAS
jgi:hypothetical protein